MKTNWTVFSIVVVLTALMVTGCATALKRNPLPESFINEAQIPYIPDARFWGDALPPHILERLENEKFQIQLNDPEARYEPVHYLALSGGGSNGAFGAGLLVGWTEEGTRPEFRVVAGISTGALSAPFAFIGPEYDVVLRKLYTTTSTDEILKKRSVFALLKADSLTDTGPLRKILEDVIDGTMVQKIAIEHKKGRRLFIGTTNLDAERPVIWNIGAIAASGNPNALQLIRDVLLASAAIPGMFPPVYFKVEAYGQTFDELHVDGGVASQVFLYPASLDLEWLKKKIGLKGEDHIFIIRNSRLEPEWTPVTPRVLSITKRSIEALIRTQGIGDLYRLYLGAQRDHLAFHLAYIPSDFRVDPKEEFDPNYMADLYFLGYKMAKEGYPWGDAPPGFGPP